MITSYTPTSPAFQLEYPRNIPLIFLAGPILGAPDWQSDADAMLRELAADMGVDEFAIFNPRRAEFKDLKDFDDTTFYEQVESEHEYLASAKNRGVRLFWLCNKTIEIPHRNYALTTLFELGEAIGYAHSVTSDKIIVAIEPGFTNEKYLHYTIAKKAPKVTLAHSLEEGCLAAIQHLKGKQK